LTVAAQKGFGGVFIGASHPTKKNKNKNMGAREERRGRKEEGNRARTRKIGRVKEGGGEGEHEDTNTIKCVAI
jgi:hypothetical protein